MYFEQFYLGCLAHASYMLGSEGEAAVVDPQRDVEIYLKAADQQGLKIRHIFETHLHADFVSGHLELAKRTGAKIYIGAQAGATFPHIALQDGSEVRFGKLRITALETPGHTPEGVCLVVTDEEKSQDPWAVLTGDTLFIGDVGRPDLSKSHTPQQLAGMMYDSLHGKLIKLSDDVLVYPAHGAGSLCGRNMRAERSSTIGTERLTNYALQIKSAKNSSASSLRIFLRARNIFCRMRRSIVPALPRFQNCATFQRSPPQSLASCCNKESLCSMSGPTEILPPRTCPAPSTSRYPASLLHGLEQSWDSARVQCWLRIRRSNMLKHGFVWRASALRIRADFFRAASPRGSRLDFPWLLCRRSPCRSYRGSEVRICRCLMCVANRSGRLDTSKARNGSRWITSRFLRLSLIRQRLWRSIARVDTAA